MGILEEGIMDGLWNILNKRPPQGYYSWVSGTLTKTQVTSRVVCVQM